MSLKDLHGIFLSPLSCRLNQIDQSMKETTTERSKTYGIVFLFIGFVCSSNVRYQRILECRGTGHVIENVIGVCLTSGLGSHRSEQIESNTLEMVNAGDHWERRISRQMAPFELMFGWKIFVVNLSEMSTMKRKRKGRGILTWFSVVWMDSQPGSESKERRRPLGMDYRLDP